MAVNWGENCVWWSMRNVWRQTFGFMQPCIELLYLTINIVWALPSSLSVICRCWLSSQNGTHWAFFTPAILVALVSNNGPVRASRASYSQSQPVTASRASYSQHHAYHMYLKFVYVCVAFVHIHVCVLTILTAHTCNTLILYKLFCVPHSSLLLLAFVYVRTLCTCNTYIRFIRILLCFFYVRTSYPVIFSPLCKRLYC